MSTASRHTATRYGPHVTADPYGHITVEPVDPDRQTGTDPCFLLDFGSALEVTVGKHNHGSTRLDADTARHLADALHAWADRADATYATPSTVDVPLPEGDA